MSDPTPTPDAAMVDEAAEMLGCIPMTDRVAANWCGIHGHWDTFMDGLPCPVAVDLAAKIAARDARRDAQKSELIRVVHDDVDTQRAQTPFLDEFVARGVNVHFEAMSNAQFWIGIDFADGTKWSINCGAVNPNAKGYAFAEQDSP